MRSLKKYAEWEGSLGEYLNVGDLVDQEFVDYFLNVLPPVCWTREIIQMGEPYSHVAGRATYSTLKKTPDGWEYAGNCYRGQTENMVIKPIISLGA